MLFLFLIFRFWLSAFATCLCFSALGFLLCAALVPLCLALQLLCLCFAAPSFLLSRSGFFCSFFLYLGSCYCLTGTGTLANLVSIPARGFYGRGYSQVSEIAERSGTGPRFAASALRRCFVGAFPSLSFFERAPCQMESNRCHRCVQGANLLQNDLGKFETSLIYIFTTCCRFRPKFA